MAVLDSPEYQPGFWEKIYIGIRKRAPYYFGRFLQFLAYTVFQAVKFIIEMFKEAVGK